jgi:4-amino-4-deoxy-L-arabinose transferase-like glycosyltransferase
MKSNIKILTFFEKNKLFQNPFFLFLPFLILYIILVIINRHLPLGADSYVYLMFAENLLNGFYSPPFPNINLIESPGYPLILVPFVALKLPLISILLMNALFHYLSIVFLYKSLRFFLPSIKALIFATLYASCYSSYYLLNYIYTEPLSLFLISILMFYIIKTYQTDVKKYMFVAGLVLGYMALVKVIFPYVLFTLFIYFSILYIFKRSSVYKKGLSITLVAFLVLLPYLFYTYNLTGKLFYFGSAGNDTLYWMSTPYENEYGSWNNSKFEANSEGPEKGLGTELFKSNHQENFDKIEKLYPLEKDDALLEMAIINIKNNPVKYLKNCVANVSRLFFSFPKNYTFERPIYKIWYFSIIYVLLLYSLLVTLFNWKSVSFSIRVVFLLSSIYLGGSSLVSVDNRQLILILPALMLWIGYMVHKTVVFKPLDVSEGSKI